MLGLALVNIGGLRVSTVLTLVFLPTYYNVVRRMENILKSDCLIFTRLAVVIFDGMCS